MRWFIRIVLGIWFVIMCFVAAALTVGHMLHDGEMIAFQSSDHADTDIYLHDVRTGIAHDLTRLPVPNSVMRRIWRDRWTSFSSYYPAQLTNYEGDDVSPAWSPDGRQLAFVSYREGNAEIFLLNLHTGRLRNLTDHPGVDTSPVWSPDSTKLAFHSLREGYRGIWVIEVDTGEIRALTGHARFSQSPTWSPDSKQIAFQSQRGHYSNIYVVDLETGETHNLTNSTRGDFNPVWGASP